MHERSVRICPNCGHEVSSASVTNCPRCTLRLPLADYEELERVVSEVEVNGNSIPNDPEGVKDRIDEARFKSLASFVGLMVTLSTVVFISIWMQPICGEPLSEDVVMLLSALPGAFVGWLLYQNKEPIIEGLKSLGVWRKLF